MVEYDPDEYRRIVQIQSLNEGVNLVSSYPEDTMQMLLDMALQTLTIIREGKRKDITE
jgi:type II secretory pathway component PulC